MRVGIDGSAARDGGGITYLAEMLRHADPDRDGFERVTVWGGEALLRRLPSDRQWLDRVHVDALEKPLVTRIAWQSKRLAGLARDACDVLFVPGGSYGGEFRPFATIFQNMLVFDHREAWRYAPSYVYFRLLLLRWLQSRTFRAASGVIFLNDFARSVCESRGVHPRKTAVIPHGISDDFRMAPRPQREDESPFRLVYTSIIDLYKHQWNVAEAVVVLRKEGVGVTLETIGGAYAPALRRLQAVIARDPNAIRIRGFVPHSQLPAIYRDADAFVFASSCENLPNILIEAMAAGLPIASSDRPPMPDLLGDAGLYFDPENIPSITAALRRLITDPGERRRLASRAFERSEAYSWSRCAGETFAFFRSVIP